MSNINRSIHRHGRIVHRTDADAHGVSVAATLAVGHGVAKAITTVVIGVGRVNIAAVGVDANATVARRSAAHTVTQDVIFDIARGWQVATQRIVFVGARIAVGRCRGVV